MKDSAKLLNFNVNRELKFEVFRGVSFDMARPLSFNTNRDLSFNSGRDLGFGKRGVVFRGYVCPVCRAPVAKDAPNCDECGVKFEQPKPPVEKPKKTFAEQLQRNRPKQPPQAKHASKSAVRTPERRSTFQCPGCETVLYVGAEKCPVCSTRFSGTAQAGPASPPKSPPQLEAVFCESCNYRIPPTDRFCRRCGSPRPKNAKNTLVSWDEYASRNKSDGLVSWDEYVNIQKGG